MITMEPPSHAIPGLALSLSGLTRFLNRARQIVGISGEVEVLLTSDLAIRRLNRRFRRKDKATDVLSFPSPKEISIAHAGDLAISLETAARQAAAYGHSLRDEVRILLLHGLLHLSGLDHETDQGEMAVREAALRRELRLPETLIKRTQREAATAASRRERKTLSPAMASRPEAPTPPRRQARGKKRGSQ